MCIAILKPKDKTISKEILQTCSKSNPDGMGFAYIKDDKIHINKYMKFEDFYEDYIQVETTSPMLIHFRIATHGKVEVKNCHPFRLNNRMALIHNGVMSGYGDKQLKTDTQDFIDKVIGNISWKMWKNPSYRQLVGDAIGYSKFAILDVTGDYYIINEQKGVWDDGVWYSNSSYKPKEVTYYKQTKLYDDEDVSWYNIYKKKQDEIDKKEENKSNIVEEELTQAIYKCNKCSKEFNGDYYGIIKCPHCKSDDIEDIGCMYDGTKYYYDEYENNLSSMV